MKKWTVRFQNDMRAAFVLFSLFCLLHEVGYINHFTMCDATESKGREMERGMGWCNGWAPPILGARIKRCKQRDLREQKECSRVIDNVTVAPPIGHRAANRVRTLGLELKSDYEAN